MNKGFTFLMQLKNMRLIYLIITMLALSLELTGQEASKNVPEVNGSGSIVGTVVDQSGAVIPHVLVRLLLDGRGRDQQVETTTSGEFEFQNVPAGAFRLTLSANGFAVKTLSGKTAAGERANLGPTSLAITSLTTEVVVKQTQVELAQEQIKVEEGQRLLALVPDYFTSYDHDAAPLNTRQKFELTTKTIFDPSTFVIDGIIAGVWQAENTHPGFGQGAEGYGKRYGAAFADYATREMLDHVVTTTLFRQDPRFFYKSTGTTREKTFYALSRTFICRGDNKKDQFCYSAFATRYSTGFITNYYYPSADRDSAQTIVTNATISLGYEALGNLFREFVAPKITWRRKMHAKQAGSN